MRKWVLGLAVLSSIGCGVAAKPLPNSGATVEAGAATDASQSAWFRCFGRRDHDRTPVTVVARYRDCTIIVAATRESFEWGNRVPLWLGHAGNLHKADPAQLVKALARYDDELHIVLRFRQSDEAVEETYPDRPALHEQVGCDCRGMPNDFDCRPESIALLLDHPDVAELEVWNRFWVHWK